MPLPDRNKQDEAEEQGMTDKPKFNFKFNLADKIDFTEARPAKVYSLRCAQCGKVKTIRASTKMGRRRKYCDDKCAEAKKREYNKKYCASAAWRKKRRQWYWDDRRAEQEKRDREAQG